MPISESLMVALIGMIVVMAELALLAVFIILMSKIIRVMTAKRAAETSSAACSDSVSVITLTLPKTQSAGLLDLHDIDDRTAAMLMAIVSDEAGIPLNELRFKSIKALD